MAIARRKLGDRLVNPVGLGCMNICWAYGAPPSESDALNMLNRALDLGYDHLDTANIYGLGRSETLIAKALKGRRDDYFLASKMGIVIDGERRGIDCSAEAIRRSIDESLLRLETDHIDLYYMHRLDPKVPIAESMGAMAELVQAGKIRHVGVSEWSAAHIREAHAVHPLAAVQTEYSLWSRNAEIAVLDVCAELGISFVAFSPVGRGALANGVDQVAALGEKDIRRLMPRFTDAHWPANRALIDQLCAIGAREGATPAQLSLAWLHSRAPHIVTIPGTRTLDHAAENIARWDWELTPALMDELNGLINTATVSGRRYGRTMQATIDTETFAGEI